MQQHNQKENLKQQTKIVLPYCHDKPKGFFLYLLHFMYHSSPFFMIWISMMLMYGVICANSDEMGRDEFYHFIFFLQHPLVIFINTCALLSSLFHTGSYLTQYFTKLLFLGVNKLRATFYVTGLLLSIVGLSLVLLFTVLK